MTKLNLKRAGAIVALLALTGVLSTAQALEPTVVTFDDGEQGWVPGGDCGTIYPEGGHPGAYWNVASELCDGSSYILQGWFELRNDTNPAFIGDYGAKGPVRVSVDVDVIDYTYYWFNSPVEEYRQVVFEFIDYDNPYTDPDTGYFWPYTSLIYPAGYLPNRDAGWKSFFVDIADPNATELPAGWTGFGGPEDPNTYLPQLPPGRTFADVLAGVDQLKIHSVEPGYFYDFGFIHDLNFDNIAITELPQECDGVEATVWVDVDGIVHGGEYDGLPYTGELVGTQGDDVIVGTDGNDMIQGLRGNDVICGGDGDDDLIGNSGNDMIFGGDGDDTLIGQRGIDFLHGGDGRDVINGGADGDTCIAGEVVTQCGATPGGGNDPRTEISPRTSDSPLFQSR